MPAVKDQEDIRGADHKLLEEGLNCNYKNEVEDVKQIVVPVVIIGQEDRLL